MHRSVAARGIPMNIEHDPGEVAAEPEKLNGASDPLLARLLEVAGPDDTRPDVNVLQELELLAGELAAKQGAAASELRKGTAWEHVHQLRAEVAAGTGDAAALVLALAAVRRALARVPSAADHALALLKAPPVAHMRTGLQTLDEITEGGLRVPGLHVVAGEPNLGKTSLVTQMAVCACQDEFVVGFHVADVDDRSGIILRIAQASGIDRRAFLAHDENAITEAAHMLCRWPHLHIIDEAADDRTVEETAEFVLEQAAATGRRAVLFVDSLQTVGLRWTPKNAPRTDKDRIDQIVRVLKGYKSRGLGVIATSEVQRSQYGGPKKRRLKYNPAPPALAAFKGSGNIEYALWTGLVLTRIAGDDEAVRVEVPKNKQCRQDVTFRLTRSEDRVGYIDRGEFVEDDKPAPREDAPDAPPREPPLVREARDILMHQSPVGRASWLAAIGKSTIKARVAIRWLIEQGEAVPEKGPGQSVFYRWRSPQ